MPRTARASAADSCYHVLNRGNGRAEVFHKPDDYDAFLALLGETQARLPMRVLGWCLMPNHFHLVLRPHGDGDLSRFMQRLLTAHVRRYRRHYGSSGHVWQGRFKAFPAGTTTTSSRSCATSSATPCAPGWSTGPSVGRTARSRGRGAGTARWS